MSLYDISLNFEINRLRLNQALLTINVLKMEVCLYLLKYFFSDESCSPLHKVLAMMLSKL